MVFYFKARPEDGDYTIFMGIDKHENEELIKYGFPEDIWYFLLFYLIRSMSCAQKFLIYVCLGKMMGLSTYGKEKERKMEIVWYVKEISIQRIWK